MGYGFIVLIVIVLAVIGAFAVLASTVVRNWRAGSRGKETVDAARSEQNIEFERCFNECMASVNWDPDKEEMCRSKCREAMAQRSSSDKAEVEGTMP